LVGGFGQDEGFRVLLVMIDKVANGGSPAGACCVNSAPNLFFGQLGELALDQIQPRSRGGSEVQLE
jgi:hypothetical protein